MRKFSRYAWSVLGFNLAVILWGALVRASGSGDGCGDHWPLCNGTVIPHAAQIATLIEFTHRATTGLALIAVVAMVVWAFRAYPRGRVRTAASASLFLILMEALLGAGLVLFGYTGTNASTGRAVYLGGHLVNTLLMIGAMALTAVWGSHEMIEAGTERHIKWNTPAMFAILSALLIAATGTIAALSETLFPSASLHAGWTADFAAASPLFVRLRIWHPIIALMAGGYIAAVALAAAYKPGKTSGARRLGFTVAGLVGAQIACGLLNLWLLAPVWMQMIHLLIADLLWIALVVFAAETLESTAPPPIKAGHMAVAQGRR